MEADGSDNGDIHKLKVTGAAFNDIIYSLLSLASTL